MPTSRIIKPFKIMENEKEVPFIEVVLILAGCLVYYFSHSADFFESLGGLVGMSLGAIFVGYIPYVFLKEKIKNPKIKIFSVAFLLVNLLVFISGQAL